MGQIHKFNLLDKYIILDVNSTSIFIVDKIAYEIVEFLDLSTEDLQVKFPGFNLEDIQSAKEELVSLVDSGYLYSPDINEEDIHYNQDNIIKALCLHVSHDCDLRCKYCFAGQGDFSGDRSLMSLETGKKALEFLVTNSGQRRNLEVDFFGGEPLMNFDVVKELTLYGKELNEKHGKNIRFTLTTNGVLLDEDKIDFINKHMVNVVLSLDGRKDVNDRMRPTINEKGSYDIIVPKFQKLIKGRGDKDYYIRGTFTGENLDFSEDVLEFHRLGFHKVSIEPVVTDPSEPYAIREEDLEQILKEYEALAKAYMEINKSEKFVFFHFMVDMEEGPCMAKRSVGCGAGSEYISITPEGHIYPCHQFTGDDSFIIGNLEEGIVNDELRESFRKADIHSKEVCKSCWAKYYCSGGCHANAYYSNETIHKPYEIGCEMQKKRTELGIAILANQEEGYDEEMDGLQS